MTRIITDRIWGQVEINSPAILELIDSAPMQRLKGISQMGLPEDLYFIPCWSRFEHSVGVMLLLKKLGASEEEQISGLLHDVSHTTFSHLIDWLMGSSAEENFQDSRHHEFILHEPIAGILTRHGFDPERIVDCDSFSLLEQPRPHVCADRVDYSIREMPAAAVKICRENLVTHNGRIVFKNHETARVFAEEFLKINNEHWAGFEAVSRYELFARLLRYALDRGYIIFEDFNTTDAKVITKLRAAADPFIEKYLTALSQKSLAHLPRATTPVTKKMRWVDPEFFVDSAETQTTTLSAVNPDFARTLAGLTATATEYPATLDAI